MKAATDSAAHHTCQDHVTLYEEFGPGDHIRAIVSEKPLFPTPLT